MKHIETHKIIEALGEQTRDLPQDKKLHIGASYMLCSMVESHHPKSTKIPTSLDIMKSILTSLKVGMRKEFEDAGKGPKAIESLFDEMLDSLDTLNEERLANNLDAPQHENDLLADMIGNGLYSVCQGLRGLIWAGMDKDGNEIEILTNRLNESLRLDQIAIAKLIAGKE